MTRLLLVIFLSTTIKAYNDNGLVENDLGLDYGDYEDDVGGSCYLYYFKSGLFREAKRKDLFCEGSFCMQKEKLVLEQMLDKDNEYRKVQNEEMISQCAPSLGVKVIHNSVRLFFFHPYFRIFQVVPKVAMV